MQNLTPIGVRGGNAPPNGKKIHCLVKSRLVGAKPFTDFYSCYAQLSFISVSHLTRFASQNHRLLSYCWETARRSLTPNISEHPVGKLCIGSKNDFNIFNGLDVLYHVQGFGEIELGAPAVGGLCYMVFVCFLCYALCAARSSFEAHSIVSPFTGQFWFCFQLFSKGIVVSDVHSEPRRCYLTPKKV